MMIGHFVSNPDGTRFQGELGYPFPCALVLIDPAKRVGNQQPDYVVTTHSPVNIYEIGAGWQRTSKGGKQYISIKLDSPMFPQPVNCALLQTGRDYTLVWRRDQQQPANSPVNHEMLRVLKALYDETAHSESIDNETAIILMQHAEDAIAQAEAADEEPCA